MSPNTRHLVRWVVLPALVCILLAFRFVWPVTNRLPVTISKETTYITEPLRADGYPDYVAALNQRMSEGVTPENNAAVLFWQAMGPGEIKPEHRETYFQLLGMSPPAATGDYHVWFGAYLTRLKAAGKLESLPPVSVGGDPRLEQADIAMQRPWSKDEFPLVADWLAANEKPLALLAKALKRPRFYDPRTCEADGKMPADDELRSVFRSLSARAMLRIHENKMEDAWQDLLNGHRLARMAGRGPFLLDACVASGIEGSCFLNDRVFLQHFRPSAAQATKMRADLGNLPSMSRLADKVDVGERLLWLDRMTAEAGGTIPAFRGLVSEREAREGFITGLSRATINWNSALHASNSAFDGVAEVLREPTREKRKRALAASPRLDINEAIIQEHWTLLIWASLLHGRRATSEQFACNRVGLCLGAF